MTLHAYWRFRQDYPLRWKKILPDSQTTEFLSTSAERTVYCVAQYIEQAYPFYFCVHDFHPIVVGQFAIVLTHTTPGWENRPLVYCCDHLPLPIYVSCYAWRTEAISLRHWAKGFLEQAPIGLEWCLTRESDGQVFHIIYHASPYTKNTHPFAMVVEMPEKRVWPQTYRLTRLDVDIVEQLAADLHISSETLGTCSDEHLLTLVE